VKEAVEEEKLIAFGDMLFKRKERFI